MQCGVCQCVGCGLGMIVLDGRDVCCNGFRDEFVVVACPLCCVFGRVKLACVACIASNVCVGDTACKVQM